MYPEDRVLVAYVPKPTDFNIAQTQGWYRIPQQHVPKGLHAEYIAFYFGRNFGPEKWAVHYYAPRLGHELVTRRQIIPEEPNHPRADDIYYKVQLGSVQQLERPIISLRWRRVTFIHTTWDRFMDATEINDLFIEGGDYVDRVYAALKDRGIQPERQYHLAEADVEYKVPLTVLCQNGRIDIYPEQHGHLSPQQLAEEIVQKAAAQGGLLSQKLRVSK